METEIKLPDVDSFLSLTDGERSVLILQSLQTIITNQSNHLRHHWAITLVGVAAGLAGLFNLGIAMLILFFRI